jgi:hypothetical protein
MRSAILLCFGVIVVGGALGACGGAKKAYIPVDSPLRTWAAPEGDAYTPDPPSASPPPSKEAKKTEKR